MRRKKYIRNCPKFIGHRGLSAMDVPSQYHTGQGDRKRRNAESRIRLN